MSEYNWCHGPECHEKVTTDRVRGVKGNKVLRTRKVKVSTYGSPNNSWNWFCSHGCERDFWAKYGNAIRQIAPRTEPLETPIEDPKKVTRETSYGYTYTNTEITKKQVDSPNTNSVG
jgi:hypothetical protein